MKQFADFQRQESAIPLVFAVVQLCLLQILGLSFMARSMEAGGAAGAAANLVTSGATSGATTHTLSPQPVKGGTGAEVKREHRGAGKSLVLKALYTLDRPWAEQHRDVATMMSQYWMNFTSKGHPNDKGRPART